MTGVESCRHSSCQVLYLRFAMEAIVFVVLVSYDSLIVKS